MSTAFDDLGLRSSLILAPLAGVSDVPFRRICQSLGADLTYVEMLSATALVYQNPRTLAMLERHPEERLLGVQLTASNPQDMGKAVAILDEYPFDTIDINMGCPVKKIVKVGCGSALLKSPPDAFKIIQAARMSTQKPLSVKIRLGWDHQSYTFLEIGKVAEEAGADWITIHGRTRSDDYSAPVDLEKIAELKSKLGIPVVGNGNILSPEDAKSMCAHTKVDALMVSRGALGNPWIFGHIKEDHERTSLSSWKRVVLDHFDWQQQAYGQSAAAVVRMRKHLLWYTKGWPGARHLRDRMNHVSELQEAIAMIEAFADDVEKTTVPWRLPPYSSASQSNRFSWDPKFEMDRQFDRAAADEFSLAE
jgi:nifR3 family TIM-barrel protein